MRIVPTEVTSSPRDLLGFDNPAANGVTNKIGDRVDSKLPQDACSMGFRSAHADAQRRCDVLIALPFSQQLHNLTLARAERMSGL